MQITLNKEQKLFVFKGDEFVSCMGFDVVFNHCREMARRIKKFQLLPSGTSLAPVLESEIGTMAQYQQYKDFLAIIGNRKTGTWFDYETPSAVRKVIEECRTEGRRVRIFNGDRKTGRSGMCEYDVVGTIGRSTGPMQIPILLTEWEYGGLPVLDASIVRIIDANSKKDLYRHKTFHVPEMEIRPANTHVQSHGLTHGVWVKNLVGKFENHANFKSYGKAAQWVAFMSGDCTEQP